MHKQRGDSRDYIPKSERNVKERMGEGASLKDGVSGRMEVTKRRPHYRQYNGEKPEMDPMSILFGGMFDE